MHLKDTFRTVVSITADEQGNLPTKIQIMPLGVFDSPTHGQFNILSSDAQEYINNFVNGGFRTEQLPIDLDHGGAYGENSEAAGWITDLELQTNQVPDTANGVYASVDWTPLGAQKLLSRQYRYFSPEFCPTFMDGMTGQLTGNVLMGGGLVNRPFFRNMTPVVAHDKAGKQAGDPKPLTLFIQANETGNMKKTELLAKEPETIIASAEADTVKNVAVADTQREDAGVAAAPIAEVVPAQQEVEEVVIDQASTTDEANGTSPVGEPDGEGGTIIAADSVKITITAGEKLAMEAKILAGEKALAEVRTLKAGDKVKGWLFNDKGTGKFTPRIASDLTSFYSSLSESQAQAFEVLVEKMPNVKLFTEVGQAAAPGSSSAVTAADQLTKLADEEFSKRVAAGDNVLQFVSVYKEMGRLHPDLVKLADDEQRAKLSSFGL